MSHHLNEHGQFQNVKYPNLAPDGIVLSFRDPAAMEALYVYAELTEDDDLAVAIGSGRMRLRRSLGMG